MISLDSFCLYCFIAHIANFAFWITLEMMPRPAGDHSFNAFMILAFSFLAISAIVALGQIQKRDMDVATGEQLQDELAATIAKQSQPKQEPPAPKPSPATATEPTVTTSTESPATGTGTGTGVHRSVPPWGPECPGETGDHFRLPVPGLLQVRKTGDVDPPES